MSQPTIIKNNHRLIRVPRLVFTRGTAYSRALYAGICLLLFLLLPLPVFSAERTTVIYPEISGPYKDVFETILKGIATDNVSEIHRYPLAKDYQLQELQLALTANKSDSIISLGKRGYLAVKQLRTDLPAVFGALSMVPNGISGVSLSADPDQLFARLKSLAPNSKKVFVVYSEKHSGWLIQLAKQAAINNGIQLAAYPANDLREAMLHYRSILKESNSGTDAIWLPLDKVTVNDDVVLPMLLQKAWDKNLSIISNKPSHAKRGALFAMYPDNYGLGQELAKFLEQRIKNSQPSQVIPLKKLLLAINLRTAGHLGLNFTTKQQEDFTLTFPSR